MQLFTLDEYRKWRKGQLANPAGDCIDTPRGHCTRLEPFIVHDKTHPDFHLANRAIEDAEFELIFHNTIINPDIIAKLYENDDDLFQSYRQLDIGYSLTRRRRLSRKSIKCVPTCCLSYWQLHDRALTVVSRSLDLKCAGLSDVAVVNRAAQALDCTSFTFMAICPHIYTDTTKTARRTNENTRV